MLLHTNVELPPINAQKKKKFGTSVRFKMSQLFRTAMAEIVSVTNEREIQPMQLSLEQLSSLKTQHENEIQEFKIVVLQCFPAHLSTIYTTATLLSPYQQSHS